MMDTQERIAEWFQKMGYDEKLPENLGTICNPSTAFLWEQIISNVKPRREVEFIRENIIVGRLRDENPDEDFQNQSEFRYAIKEIVAYEQKQKIEKKLKYLEEELEEKEEIVDKLLTEYKMKRINVDHLKQKVRENELRAYLLENKSEMLSNNIQQVEEMLTLAKNLTPVEIDEESSGKEITETLQKCAEKLQKHIEAISSSNSQAKTNLDRSSFINSMRAMKTPGTSKKNCFERYLKSESHPATARKKLPMSIEEESGDKENRRKKAAGKSTKKSEKRESLGLLPDSFLDPSDELGDDEFLTSDKNNCSRQLFFDDSNPDKTIFDLPIEENPQSLKPNSVVDEFCSNEEVRDALKVFLYRFNKQAILKGFRRINDELLSELQNVILDCNKVEGRRVICQKDLTELYLLHVKNELTEIKYKGTIEKLRQTLKKQKKNVYSQLVANKSFTMSRAEEVKKVFKLQIEEAQMDAANKFLRREVNSFHKSGSPNELQGVSTKIKKLNNAIDSKVNLIEDYIQNTCIVVQSMKGTAEEVVSCVRKLRNFVADLSWIDVLRGQLCSKEIETFENFPVEYNRKIKIDGKIIPYRDICNSTVPSYIDLNASNLYALTTLMDDPFSPAEDIIYDLLRSKMKLDVLKSMDQPQNELNCILYSLEELNSKESYLSDTITELNSTIDSSAIKETLESASAIKNAMELWMEMPFSNYVSDKRTVEGRNLSFYEKKYDEFLNGL